METWIEEICDEKIRFGIIDNTIKQIVLKHKHGNFVEVVFTGGYKTISKDELQMLTSREEINDALIKARHRR